MTQFSYGQLETLWENAGGPKKLAPLAAAIAMAESGGNSDSLNKNDNGGKQTSVGLWQVSNGTHQYPQSWLTPQGNAQEAVAKFKGAGDSFAPWGTFVSGAYKKFLKGNVPSATLTAAQSSGPSSQQQGQQGLNEWFSWIQGFGIPLQFLFGSAQSIADVATGVAETEKVINEFFHYVSWLFVPAHWLRILCFILGVPLVGMGLIVLTIGTKPVPVSAYGVGTEVSTGGIAPAMGIAEVTLGAVLLFFAFHNLEAEGVTNFQGMLGYIKNRVNPAPANASPAGSSNVPAGIPPAGIT